MLNSIIDLKGSSVFFTISNADEKIWIIPKRNMRTAIQLYQPSGIRGKLVKQLLPYFYSLKFIRRKLGITTHYYDLHSELKKILIKLFHVNNPEFSIFCGTPSAHQKITMQISIGDKILGYCKFSNNIEVKEIFKYEESILESLHEKGLNNIPKCLYRGSIKDDIDILVQTTSKTKHSKIIHEITESHWNYLSTIYNKTKHEINFVNTDLHRILVSLLAFIENFPEKDKQDIMEAIKRVNKYYEGQKNNFCLYHGDFTPWNMFIEQGNLFVFDWEYAQSSFPPYLDALHFFTQVSLFKHHLPPEVIFIRYKKIQENFSRYISNTDITYLCYLLFMIYHCMDKEKGVLSDSVKRCLDAWIAIIKSLLNEENTIGIWNSPRGHQDGSTCKSS